MYLIRQGHDFLYSARNRMNPDWQIYFFTDSPELRKDMAAYNGDEYLEENP